MYKVGYVYKCDDSRSICLGYGEHMFLHYVSLLASSRNVMLKDYMIDFEPYLMHTKKELHDEYVAKLSRCGIFISEKIYNQNKFTVHLAGPSSWELSEKYYDVQPFLIKARLMNCFAYYLMDDKEFKERVEKAFDEYYMPIGNIDYDWIFNTFYLEDDSKDNLNLYYSPDKNAYYTAINGNYYKILQLRNNDTLHILSMRREALARISFDNIPKIVEQFHKETENIKMLIVKSTRRG